MAIEVNGVNRIQAFTSTASENQSFNPNGKIAADAKVAVKKVDETQTDSKIKGIKESDSHFEVKPIENSEANKERIQKLLDDINSSMYSYNKELHFSVNEHTKDLVIKVVNGRTGEVMQQYPAQEIVDMREKLLEGKTTGLGLESQAN